MIRQCVRGWLLAVVLLPGLAGAQQTIQLRPNIQSPLTQPQISPQALTLAPVISGVTPTACIKPGDRLTLKGQYFGDGSGRGVALGGHGRHVDARILRWQDRLIELEVPRGAPLEGSKRYYIAIEKADHTAWLSKLDHYVTVCSTAVGGLPAATVTPPLTNSVNAVPSASLPPASEPAESTGTAPETASVPEQPPGDDGVFDTAPPPSQTPTLPPSTGGSLMGSSLPPPPSLPPGEQAQRFPTDAEPDELVVMSADMASAIAVQRRAGQQGIRVLRRQSLGNLGLVVSVFQVPENMTPAQARQLIGEADEGAWVDFNHRYELQGGQPRLYAREAVGLNEQPVDCGSALRIGVLDTLAEAAHPALVDADLTQQLMLPGGMAEAARDHGTAVVATLVGNGGQSVRGLVPGAKVYVAGVFRQRDRERVDTTTEWLVLGLDWLMSVQVSVVNLSLGGSRNLALEAALTQIMARGVLVVAAAGNAGADAPPVFPAAQPGVVAVTAVDADRHLYRSAVRGDYIMFSAPGVDVWVAQAEGGAYRSGTSYATPYVSAMLARVRQKLGVAGRQAVDTARGHVLDLGEAGYDPAFGWGLVQWTGLCNG